MKQHITTIKEWFKKLNEGACLDGQLHEWSKWKETDRGTGKTFGGSKVIVSLQERKCKKCNEIDLYLART